MDLPLSFIQSHMGLLLLLFAGNVVFSLLLSRHLSLMRSWRVLVSMGARSTAGSLYRKSARMMAGSILDIGRATKKSSLFVKTKTRMKKAGYTGEHAAHVFLLIRFGLSPVAFLTAFLLNDLDIIKPLALVVLINTLMETVVASERKKLSLRLQKHIYKLYKYLHNQITSGVKPTDAIRSVYEVADDPELKNILIRMAARYELTLDIDGSLEEFRSSYDVHEAKTLCLALKQGVETGDNKELLARQEDIMFKKYFNYIQAETDSCRNRSVLAAGLFVAIIVVMVLVPMVNDAGTAIGQIFVN